MKKDLYVSFHSLDDKEDTELAEKINRVLSGRFSSDRFTEVSYKNAGGLNEVTFLFRADPLALKSMEERFLGDLLTSLEELSDYKPHFTRWIEED